MTFPECVHAEFTNIRHGLVSGGKVRVSQAIADENANVFAHAGTSNVFAPMDFDAGGTLQVNVTATLNTHAPPRFESGSDAVINGTLNVGANAHVDAGADLFGTGVLVNQAASTLTLADGADVIVRIENRGTLVLGSSPGLVIARELEQYDSGVLQIELQGTDPKQFDRLILNGVAQLAGNLEVSLIGGFQPKVGNEFTILEATEGIDGLFELAFDMSPNDSINGFEESAEPFIPFKLIHDVDRVVLLVVPEPGTMVLGVGAMMMLSRRRLDASATKGGRLGPNLWTGVARTRSIPARRNRRRRNSLR